MPLNLGARGHPLSAAGRKTWHGKNAVIAMVHVMVFIKAGYI